MFNLKERRFAGDQQFTETQAYALQECGESFLSILKTGIHCLTGREMKMSPFADSGDVFSPEETAAFAE